ncbi:MAG: hypothetical protein ACRD0G_12170 [Acidimicrobiales bacterium]
MNARRRLLLVWVVAVGATAFSSVRGAESAPLTLENEGRLAAWGGLPPAALVPEPALPEADGWSFGDGFPRTSGTGRYAGGAYYWSDFLYDDHGAAGAGTLPGLFENFGLGGYGYPEPDAAGNGADVFRTAIGLESDATVWRVDWQTLVNPNLPIAAFALDTDANPATGGASWPANAGVQSPGIERLLVVSSRGARLIDVPAGGLTLPLLPGLIPAPAGAAVDLPVTVDVDARSFVVRVPHSVLPVDGQWTVRLASGLADPAGTGFKTLDLAHQALPGQANVYNVSFRDYDDEMPSYANSWFNNEQAEALGLGDISAFGASVDWGRMAAADTEPELLVTGRWINRWFVSSIEPHQGVREGSTGGLPTNIYGNRVQPYAIYVPTSYTGEAPTPLTFTLHASSFNHNTERLISPRFTQGACEARGSICVSPLGRAETLNWLFLAELDFWEVWNRVATTFTLDPERTIVGGHSGGGSGAFNFTMDHPDLVAGFYIINSLPGANDPDPSFYYDVLENLRWNPMYHMDSVLDGLPPVPLAIYEALQFEQLGYRYMMDVHVVEDHFTPAIRDDYDNLIAWLGEPRSRETDPGHITYRWYPHTVNREQGYGPTGAWWIQDLEAHGGGGFARVEAVSAAQPDPAVTPAISTSVQTGGPSPSVRRQLDWVVGAAPSRAATIDLSLTRVATITVELAGAGFLPGETGVVNVGTDAPVSLTVVGTDGSSTAVTLDPGQHAVPVR